MRKRLVQILPFIFMLHNMEEVWGKKMGTDIPAPMHESVTIPQFAVAVTLFTLLGFIIVHVLPQYVSANTYNLLVTGFAGMLFLNVFFPHLIGTLALGSYTPGVATAVLINLPISAYILKTTRSEGLLNTRQVVGASVIGALIGLVLVFVFLKIGEITALWL